jgi:hypothetical protein
MEPISSHGTRTSISHNTVDHAGPRELPLLLLIDSTSCSEQRTQLQLRSVHKLWLTALQILVVAKAETHFRFTNTLPRQVYQIPPVSNTSLRTQLTTNAHLPLNARTAPGHHAQLTRPVKINAGPLTTSATMPRVIPISLVLTR